MNPVSSPVASIVVLTQHNLSGLRDCLGAIEASTDPQATPYEIVLLFNGTPAADVAALRSALAKVEPLHVRLNLGFGEGNNFAARSARGDYLVFLNDDAVPQAGWLERLIGTARAHANAGAVGSRILFPDGTLQEAGGIVWSDGSTRPLGRGEPPGSLAYSYVRPVDYASANGLLVSRAVFERAGGFDGRYFPAYYEDVDLCLTLRHRLELEIYYEPRSVLLHAEAASTPDVDFRSFLFRRNQAALQEKWSAVLPLYARPEPESPIAVENALLRRRGNPPRVLLIDDRVPDPALGSGFGRARQLLEELSEARYAVTLYPSDRGCPTTHNGAAELGVDVLVDDLEAHLARPEKRYDAIVISRPHNFDACIERVRRLQPEAVVIFDAEALYHRRLRLQAALEPPGERRAELEGQAQAMEALERRIARDADRLVAISDVEAAWLRDVAGHGPLDFMRPLDRHATLGPGGTAGRTGAVFVAGWLGGEDSPNAAALHWFVRLVLPRVVAERPDFQTLVTGDDPAASVRALAGPRLIFTGRVESLDELYAGARMAIAPIRVGAGIKIKTIEAAQFGVPVVATQVGAEGMDLIDGVDIDCTDDPAEFARRILALAENDALWLQRRAAIERRLAQWHRERIAWPNVVATSLHAAKARRA